MNDDARVLSESKYVTYQQRTELHHLAFAKTGTALHDIPCPLIEVENTREAVERYRECTCDFAYDIDLNAMREVWKVLKERGLWDEFLYRWDCQTDGDEPEWTESKTYHFLNDLPGQVKAAIKVLKEEYQGNLTVRKTTKAEREHSIKKDSMRRADEEAGRR